MTEEQFINWLASEDVGAKYDDDRLRPPECFYKRFSGEINAEKIMMVVLKARSVRKNRPPPTPKTAPPPVTP